MIILVGGTRIPIEDCEYKEEHPKSSPPSDRKSQ